MTGASLPPPSLPPLLLVGGGKMGGAMLAGWCEQGISRVVVVDPAPPPSSPHPGVQWVPALDAVPLDLDPAAVVMAVKPQMAAGAVPSGPRFAGATLLSIMAGTAVRALAALAGDVASDPRPIVRAMPNTPAAIRRGITVAFPGPGVDAEARALCHTLLESVGTVEWVDDEALLDPVTAVSGSGPAYVFLLAELMERAALEQGIPPALARRLARETVSGAGALLAASPQDAADLRIAVTSPGGTTQRALAVLMEEWPDTLSRAIDAATARSRELGT